MKHFYTKRWLLTAVLLTSQVHGQQAHPFVVSGCGESSKAIGGYTISFTVGEPVISTAGNNTIFTQGFHQPASATEFPSVELNLRGTAKENHIALNWSTLTEQNNQWFYIEKSADGISFTTIDSVRTKAVNGNSTQPLYYTYADLQPFNGANFYRLRQVSTNGAIQYSQIIQVNFTGNNWRVAIFPNPVQSTLFMQLYSGQQTTAAITLHTITGQLEMRKEMELPAGYSRQSLPVIHLKSGVYILSVRDRANNLKMHVKVVKN